MRPEIQTASGAYVNLLKPDPASFTLEDIGLALSKLCRFTGHTTEFYSVAEHSVLVSKLVPRRLRLAGLLHDASEAFLGDVSSPLKSLLPEYKKIQARFEKVIAAKYNVEFPHHSSIKTADLQALATEKYYLLKSQDEWECLKGVNRIRNVNFIPLSPETAYAQFMDRLYEITRTT